MLESLLKGEMVIQSICERILKKEADTFPLFKSIVDGRIQWCGV